MNRLFDKFTKTIRHQTSLLISVDAIAVPDGDLLIKEVIVLFDKNLKHFIFA
jgi:hypothetical protein